MDVRILPAEFQNIIREVVKPNFIIQTSYEFRNKDPDYVCGRTIHRKVELTVCWTIEEVIIQKPGSIDTLYDDTFRITR